MLKRLMTFLWEGTKEFWKLAEMTSRKVTIALCAILTALILSVINPGFIWLLALAPVAFVQNMFFTLVSRSRNSQDPDYHRFCAWGSNGVWFVCQVMIVKNIWGAIHAGQWWYAIAAGVVYALATTEGSVLMMKRLIASEKGKRRVGASDKLEKMEERIKTLESIMLEDSVPTFGYDKKQIDAIGTVVDLGENDVDVSREKLEKHIDTV